MAEEALVQWVIQPRSGAPTGARVLRDGRYQSRGGHIEFDPNGTLRVTPASTDWETSFRYTPSELVAVRAALASAPLSTLPRRVAGPERLVGGGRMTWSFGSELGAHDIVLEGYPASRLAALDALWLVIEAARRAPVESSRWRVLVRGALVERTVLGAVVARPELQRIVGALYKAPGFGPTPASEGPPRVEVSFFQDGALDGVTRLYENGVLTEGADGGEQPVRTLTRPGMEQVQAALDAAWPPTLTEPPCAP